MRKSSLALMILLLPAMMFAQLRGGLSFTGGVSHPGILTLSGSANIPVLVKQLYIDTGFRSLNTRYKVTDDLFGYRFSSVKQVFVGIRLGDYLFANPRLTWNWYGKYNSLGWGFSGGLLIPVLDQLSIGYSVGFDQTTFDTALKRYGPIEFISVSGMIILRLF
jgi:prolipoprotein diacylglyceryltransferase